MHKGQSHPGEHEAIVSADLWDKVHAILGESPRKRAGSTRAQTPALLKGLIFGPTGHAMAPTHTRKAGRLYRYYVSTAVLKQGRDACPVGRVPAGEVEAAVIGQVRRLLTTPEIVVRTWRAAREQDGTIGEGEVRAALARPRSRSGTSCSRPSRRASSSSWWSGWTWARTGSASGSGRRG